MVSSSRKWLKKRVVRPVRNGFFFLLLRISIPVFRLLPRETLLRFCDRAGPLIFLLLRRERRKTLRHLAMAFGDEMTEEERDRIGKRVYANLCKNIVEMVFIPRLTRESIRELVSIRGYEKAEAALARGKGLMIITGHFGNWELIPVYFRLIGHHGGVVARKAKDRGFQRLLESTRLSQDFKVFYREDPPIGVIRTLKKNGIIGILADQDLRKLPGIFVDFFGIPAYTTPAPVQLAVKTGATLLPAFILRRGTRHEIVVEDPIPLRDTGEEEADLVHNTALWTRIVEDYIRRYPDHWVWMHPRWRTRPPRGGKVGSEKVESEKLKSKTGENR